ncbi:polysaccharide deacetylase family protein [Bacillus alveayuensis]|uniref:polysaccharide deacetylase family protein n=1 Tax=Aeribacillus alveayuensis TaxID=279215 RepID=UPI0005D0F695|nr:polysaccharide deacetylase family protein [Bacillus alveayuensis]
MLLLILTIFQNPWIDGYVHHLQHASIEAAKQKDKLYLEIEKKAKKYEIPAQDAKIDKVWKAIPGYNGLKVDVDASYKNMKKLGTFNEQMLVYKQIPPKVHLADLPPEAIYRGHPEKPMVAFLINVAWGNEYIPNMLETLKKHDVKATFFLEGRWVKNNPDMAKMIVDAGHEVGNHSYSHPDLKVMSNQAIYEQLIKTNEVIEATTGVKCKWFAPPGGSYRDDVVKIAHKLQMGTIMWSVDTIDWQKPSPSVIVERVMSNVHPGAMVLMHPTASTAQALDSLIVAIKKKEYEISNVSTLLDEERIVKK